MPDEREDTNETPNERELDSKPTITIAERQAGSLTTDSKPTITIAEREDSE